MEYFVLNKKIIYNIQDLIYFIEYRIHIIKDLLYHILYNIFKNVI